MLADLAKVLLPLLLVVGACDRSSTPGTAPPVRLPGDGTDPAPNASSSFAPGSSALRASATPPFVPERVQGEGVAMGTHLGFAAYTNRTTDRTKTRAAFGAAIDEIQRIEALMTTWRPDSEVSRINAAAGKSKVAVGEETFLVIKEALHTSEISEGTFDITFQSLHGLWKFDEDLDPHPPAEKDIKARLPLVNYRHVKIDESDRSVMLAKEGVKIGLGGIAKGYAVDRAVKVLESAGLTSFYVQAGGDLFARGRKPDGSDWQAGIRDPRGPDGKFFARLSLSDHAFSTAGDYERSYVLENKRYHHIIDPRTGFPATACRSVTIWAPSALIADEIDDAVFILGPEKGMKIVESLDGVGAIVIDAKNRLWVSKRLEGKLEVVAAPTAGP